MKKLLFSITCLLLLGYISSTSARMSLMIVGGQVEEAVGGCVKDGTPIIVSDDTDNTSNKSLGADAYGTAFITPGTGGNIYSIEVFHTTPAAGNATMRWGPGQDLTTTYYDSVQIACADEDVGVWKEYVFPEHDAYSASTTYSFGIIEDSGNLYIILDEDANYPDGTKRSGTVWNMSTSDATDDLLFKVYKCQ